MLKLIYSDTGLHLEYLSDSLEAVISRRVLLGLRLGQTTYVEPGWASLTLPACLPDLPLLQLLVRQQRLKPDYLHADSGWNQAEMTLRPADALNIEVSLTGVWLTSSAHSDEGIFLAQLDDNIEALLSCLWQQAQPDLHFLSG